MRLSLVASSIQTRPTQLSEAWEDAAFSFCSCSGCNDRILDICISLNSSFHDEDAGVFQNSIAQKLATLESFLCCLCIFDEIVKTTFLLQLATSRVFELPNFEKHQRLCHEKTNSMI